MTSDLTDGGQSRPSPSTWGTSASSAGSPATTAWITVGPAAPSRLGARPVPSSVADGKDSRADVKSRDLTLPPARDDAAAPTLISADVLGEPLVLALVPHVDGDGLHWPPSAGSEPVPEVVEAQS